MSGAIEAIAGFGSPPSLPQCSGNASRPRMSVDEAKVRHIAKLARIRRFAPGSAMVRTGDPGRSFYVVLDGTAKVIRKGGRPRRLGAGDGPG